MTSTYLRLMTAAWIGAHIALVAACATWQVL